MTRTRLPGRASCHVIMWLAAITTLLAVLPHVGTPPTLRPTGDPAQPITYQQPAFLTFEELKTLSAQPHATGPLREKYEALWRTPIISNEAYAAGARPYRPIHPTIGPFIRLVSWNIEQSLHIDEAVAAFTNAKAYHLLIDVDKAPAGSRAYQRAVADCLALEDTDIIVLQEMEIGVKRSGYRDAARELAQALHMNYAYLPQYLEIDPVQLGLETVQFADGQADVEATAYYAVDPARYRGLFGGAVLSRYPIVHVEGFRLFTQGYDWYWQEQQKTSFLEKLRRFGAKTVFRESQHREMKIGGRTYFRVDLAVPELPEQRLSIINIHLEIKATPDMRATQVAEILNYVRNIPHPVILAGDFNSAPYDLSPTSTPRLIRRGVSSPQFWFSRLLEYFVPQALLVNITRFISNATKNYQNPTAAHVPLIAPNEVAELFHLLERFRFADGGAFDFRGDRARSANDHGLLSNANERDLWAYQTTFRVERTIARLIGKYRLDWIFVKAYATHPRRRTESYQFAPHFGRTLNALNASLTRRISDHDPNMVDLPLTEPPAMH